MHRLQHRLILKLQTSFCAIAINQQSTTKLTIISEVLNFGMASHQHLTPCVSSCSSMLQYLHPTADDNAISSLPQMSVQWPPWLECDIDCAVVTRETHVGGSLRPGAQPLLYQRLVSRCDLHSGAIYMHILCGGRTTSKPQAPFIQTMHDTVTTASANSNRYSQCTTYFAVDTRKDEHAPRPMYYLDKEGKCPYHWVHLGCRSASGICTGCRQCKCFAPLVCAKNSQ